MPRRHSCGAHRRRGFPLSSVTNARRACHRDYPDTPDTLDTRDTRDILDTLDTRDTRIIHHRVATHLDRCLPVSGTRIRYGVESVRL